MQLVRKEPTRTKYLRLDEVPWINISIQCSSCFTDLDREHDCWRCRSCGTTWPVDAEDGDIGTLAEESDLLEDRITDSFTASMRAYEVDIRYERNRTRQ